MTESKELFEFRKKLKFLKAQRGQGTELISVYIQPGSNVSEVVNRLREEASQAQNIKSKQTRKNVEAAIDRLMQALKGTFKSPENGVALFCGNLDGKIELFMIIPPQKIQLQTYRCDSTFLLDPLLEMVESKDVYGLFVMDRREATIAILRGKQTEILTHMTSGVPGKHGKGGQCLASDSLVTLADGRIKGIEDISEKDCVKCANLTEKTVENTLIIDKWKTTKQDVYTISTKYPSMEIVCSGDHGFFVRNCNGIEETPARKLTKTHTLLMPEGIDVEGTEQTLSTEYYNAFRIKPEGIAFIKRKRLEKGLFQREVGTTQTLISHTELAKHMPTLENLEVVCRRLEINFAEFRKNYLEPNEDVRLPSKLIPTVAQFVGYFMGDGNFDKNRVCLSEGNTRVIKEYEKLVHELFTKQTGLTYRKKKNYWQLKVYSKTLAAWLRNELVKNKAEIPEKILLSKNNVVAAFLKGFFDAEGYVSYGHLAFGINNKKLAQMIQLALLRFGIISSIAVYDNRRNPYSKKLRYTLQITEQESLKRFFKDMAFTSKEKKKALLFTIKKKSKISRTRRVFITGKQTRAIIEKHGWNMQRFQTASMFFQNRREISKTAFVRSILNPAKANPPLYAELKKISNHQIMPVKIKNITCDGKNMEMVDLCTDKQNFIANGLVVHNSAHRFERIIEQAAEAFFTRICEHLNQYFKDPKIKGIIAGGPGPTKQEVLKSDKLFNDIKKKIIGTIETGYTDETGIKEILDKSGELIQQLEVQREKQVVQQFLKEAATGGNACYGVGAVRQALASRKVHTLLLSENLPDELQEEFSQLAEQTNTLTELISEHTHEGRQFLEGFGGVGAILRYK